MSARRRGALVGGFVGLALLALAFFDPEGGALQSGVIVAVIVLMGIASPFLPPGPPPGPILVPSFGQGAGLVASIAFVVISAGIGWLAVLAWSSVVRGGARILGWAVAAWLVGLGAYLAVAWLTDETTNAKDLYTSLILASLVVGLSSCAMYLPAMAALRRSLGGTAPRWPFVALGAVMAIVPVGVIGAVLSTTWSQFVRELVSPASVPVLLLFVAFGSVLGWGYGARAERP